MRPKEGTLVNHALVVNQPWRQTVKLS